MFYIESLCNNKGKTVTSLYVNKWVSIVHAYSKCSNKIHSQYKQTITFLAPPAKY